MVVIVLCTAIAAGVGWISQKVRLVDDGGGEKASARIFALAR